MLNICRIISRTGAIIYLRSHKNAITDATRTHQFSNRKNRITVFVFVESTAMHAANRALKHP